MNLTFIRGWMIPALVTVVLMLSISIQPAKAAQERPIKVFLDINELQFEVPPVLKNGTTLVPFRGLFEAMGLEVKWDEEKREVRGTNDQLSILLTIGQKQAVVNGQTVTLLQAPQIINGRTMVPLRFVGEATGAVVYWEPVNREVYVITESLRAILGLSKEELLAKMEDFSQSIAVQPQELSDSKEPVKPEYTSPKGKVDLNKLEGMYYGFRDDWGGYECGGMCWDLYTFLPGKRVVIGEPVIGGPETIDCKLDTCYGYTIKQGTMTLDDGDTYEIELSEDGELVIDGVSLTPVDQAPANLKLDGTYVHRGYSGLVGINTFATSWQEWLTFYSDGTYESDNLMLGTLDTKTDVTHSTNSNQNRGTYSIQGNTITLKPDDRTEVKYVFFLHFNDPASIQIGDRHFYTDDE